MSFILLCSQTQAIISLHRFLRFVALCHTINLVGRTVPGMFTISLGRLIDYSIYPSCLHGHDHESRNLLASQRNCRYLSRRITSVSLARQLDGVQHSPNWSDFFLSQTYSQPSLQGPVNHAIYLYLRQKRWIKYFPSVICG